MLGVANWEGMQVNTKALRREYKLKYKNKFPPLNLWNDYSHLGLSGEHPIFLLLISEFKIQVEFVKMQWWRIINWFSAISSTTEQHFVGFVDFIRKRGTPVLTHFCLNNTVRNLKYKHDDKKTCIWEGEPLVT